MRKMMIGLTLLGAMTSAERAKGRFMRGPEGHKDGPTLDMKTWLAGVEKKLEDHGVDAVTVKELKCRMDDLEQKSVRDRGYEGGGHKPSVGEQFIQAKSLDVANMGRTDRVSVELKATTITSATTNAAGSVGSLVSPQRDTLAELAKRRLTIRALLSVVNVTSGSVEYPFQKTHATGAAMVAEGTQKPQSDLQYGLATAQIRTIAHWVKASRQILEDAPQLQGLIDTELRYGLAIKEESQLLYGDGTGQNVPGMVPLAAAFAPAFAVTGANEIDTIGLAILQASLTDFEPEGIIIHPSKWWKMRLLKDADGKYLLGDPMQPVPANLFGLPVIPTQAMATDEFLVGAFTPQVLYDRWTARIEVGFDGNDFTNNLVTVLGEERIGFAAKQPQALITGSFDDA